MKTIKKICPKCKTDAEFGVNKARKNGLQVWCRNCLRDYNKSKRQEKNIYNRQYREFNGERINQKQRNWRKQNKDRVNENNKKYKATISGQARILLNSAKHRSKKRNRQCTITKEEIEVRLAKGHCEVTGIAFDTTGPFAPSLDRSDNSIGYIPTNVKLVIRIYNLAKRDWKHVDVVKFATALIGYSKYNCR